MTVNLVIQRQVADQSVPDDADLEQWMAVFSAAVSAQGEVTVRIVDRAEITQLNRQYRNCNQPTNILSFPFVDPPGVCSDILGDMVICAEIITVQAQQQHIVVQHHWAHMLAHGLLHLLGHDHQQEAEAQTMEEMEKVLLALLQIADPYENELQ